MFTNHRERFQQNKYHVDPNKPPPEYDDCLSVLDFRARRRKDKSRAPGMMKPVTPSLPILNTNQQNNFSNNIMYQFPVGGGAPPSMNPAVQKRLPAPPVQFIPPVMQPAPRSPTARDLEVQRCARILFDAVASAWDGDMGDSSNDDDDDVGDAAVHEALPVKASLSKPSSTSALSPQSERPPHDLQGATLQQETEPLRRRSDRKRSSTDSLVDHVESAAKHPKLNEVQPAPSPDYFHGRVNVSAFMDQEGQSGNHGIKILPDPSGYPPRNGVIIKFNGKNKRAPGKSSSLLTDPSVPERPPRNGTVIRLNGQPVTRWHSDKTSSEITRLTGSTVSTTSPRHFPVISSFQPINGKSSAANISTPPLFVNGHRPPSPVTTSSPQIASSFTQVTTPASAKLFKTINGKESTDLKNGSENLGIADAHVPFLGGPQNVYPPRNGTVLKFPKAPKVKKSK